MNVVMDLGFAVRALRKNAAFTVACLATLGVGIGITAAVFTVVNGVLLRPLPYADPSRIETIWLSSSRAALGNEIPLSAGFFADLQTNQKSFSSVAGFQSWTPALSDGGTSELVSAARITPSLFTVLGIRPALGRGFTSADGEAGSANVALISDALWQRRFSRNPAVIGRRVDLGSSSYVIVGVMPAGFSFPRGAELPPAMQFAPRTDLWAPLAFTAADRQEYRVLSIIAVGRLAPGVSVARAKMDLAAVMQASLEAHPRKNPLAYDLMDMQTQAGRHVRGTLLFLMGTVLFVLFIACANVMNLLIARTAGRRREFAMRAALGAGRGRIARQLITENLLLGTTGTALGLLTSVVVTRAMLALVPGSMPRVDDVTVDWRVVAGAGAIAIAVGSVLGAASARQVRWRTLAATLRDAGARSTAGRGTGIRRNALVIAEISLSVMLVIGALLITTSFIRLQHAEPGFDPKNTLTAGIVLPIPPAEDRDGRRFGNPRFALVYRQLVERLSKVSGVTAAAASSMIPLSSTAGFSGIRVAGEANPDVGKVPLTEFGLVEGDYFRALGIKLISGRAFESGDDATSVPVIIVNRAFERAYLDGDALGKQLLAPFDLSNGTVPRTIVGVIDNVSSTTLDEAPKPQVYLPEQQLPASSLFIVVRTMSDPMAILPIVKRELASLDGQAAVGDAQPMRQIIADSLARQRFSMTIMAVFAASALFLTIVGLYGVIALSVGERRREIGVRMALGARAADVLGMILGDSMRITLAGIGLGLCGAFALNRFVTSMLFGVSSTNVLVYGASAGAIALVALAATYIPARRAAGVDPARVLRAD